MSSTQNIENKRLKLLPKLLKDSPRLTELYKWFLLVDFDFLFFHPPPIWYRWQTVFHVATPFFLLCVQNFCSFEVSTKKFTLRIFNFHPEILCLLRTENARLEEVKTDENRSRRWVRTERSLRIKQLTLSVTIFQSFSACAAVFPLEWWVFIF